MRICRRCGVYAPPEGGVCDGCGTDLRSATRDAVSPPQRFAAVRLEVTCPHCKQWTPLQALRAMDRSICARCGADHVVDEKTWAKVLDRAHAVADLFGDHPEGREPSGFAIDQVNPFWAASRRRSGVRFAPDEADAWSGWLPATVRAWIAPGVPLGPDSFEPLQVRAEGPGVASVRTSRGEAARYVVDVRAIGIHRKLLAVIADDHRADRAEPDLALEAGGRRARCGGCGAHVGLDSQMTSVRCEECGRVSHVPVLARQRAQVDPRPDTWWLVFEGTSPYRRFLERHPSTWDEAYPGERPLEQVAQPVRSSTGRALGLLYVAGVPTLLLVLLGALSRLPSVVSWLDRVLGGYP